MHREQHKCKLKRLPLLTAASGTSYPYGSGGDPDYQTFSANLHSAKLNLLPHMVFTAVMDACRGVKSGVRTAAHRASTRASRRHS